jgi:hypothetical protein
LLFDFFTFSLSYSVASTSFLLIWVLAQVVFARVFLTASPTKLFFGAGVMLKGMFVLTMPVFIFVLGLTNFLPTCGICVGWMLSLPNICSYSILVSNGIEGAKVTLFLGFPT